MTIDLPPIPLSLVPLSGVADPADCWPRCYDVDDAGTIVPVEDVSADGIDPSAAVFDVNKCMGPRCNAVINPDDSLTYGRLCPDCYDAAMMPSDDDIRRMEIQAEIDAEHRKDVFGI